MKRTIKYALSVVMASALVLPAIAQDNFPDVAENHWAYEALARMKKEGILVGFPDGKYRGNRPATRYELAVAINAVYTNLKGITDGLDQQIKAINDKLSGTASASDLDNLRSTLKELQDEVNGMKAYGQDIADLKRMAAQFEKELSAIGVDVDELKKNLGDLDKRVSVLEAKKLPVDIHGDLNFVTLNGYGRDYYGITLDGRPTGVGRGSYGAVNEDLSTGRKTQATSTPVVGITRDFTVLHDAAVVLTSTNDTGPKWRVVGEITNMLGVSGNFRDNSAAGFGNQSQVFPGSPFIEGDSSFFLQAAEISDHAKVANIGFTYKLGRVSYKMGDYIFARPDNTPYYANDRWDNGEWTFDGGIIGFNIGSGKLAVLAGRTSDLSTQDGTPFQSMTAGANSQPLNFLNIGDGEGTRPIGFNNTALLVDQFLGANLAIPLGEKGSVDVSYLVLDSNTDANVAASNGSNNSALANRAIVYGGDLKYNLAGFNLNGGYSRSDLMYNNRKIVTGLNQRATGTIGYEKAKYGIIGGYKYIEPYYGAPGYWGRIGIWWNPTDIEGGTAEAYYNLTKNVQLKGTGEFYEGTGKLATGLKHNDNIFRWTVGLGYKLGGSSTIDLGWEQVQWKLHDQSFGDGGAFTGGKPVERWYNIGFGFDVNSMTKFNVLWQISDYDGKGVAGFDPFATSGISSDTKARGGLITTQLSIKF